MEQLIAVNYKGDMGAMSKRDGGVYSSPAFGDMMAGLGANVVFPASHRDMADYFNGNYSKGDRVFSGDHVVTYFPMSTINANRQKYDVDRNGKIGLVVFDQHIDAYKSYKGLNRANVMRRLIEEGKVDHVIIAGVRPSESALYTGNTKGLNIYDKAVSMLYGGEFSDVKDKITIVPAAGMKSIPDVVEQSVKSFRGKGIENIGIDFDLDVFDSEKIKGVGYSLNSLGKFPLLERIFIRNQLNQEGYDPQNVRAELSGVNGVLQAYKGKINPVYKGVTEIELENEGRGSTATADLVRDFAECF